MKPTPRAKTLLNHMWWHERVDCLVKFSAEHGIHRWPDLLKRAVKQIHEAAELSVMWRNRYLNP